ncbi:MAG: adenosylcobinamide-GDP ribazoletransferase, partial [Thermoguttaceae bacterium]|nr:adenosylcobinamide-GDP ribazoletransferase [Thermoguttaceae bacterium]
TREEKLQILKDPHIGAFAVIGLAKLALVWLAALAIVVDSGSFPPLYAVAAIFFGARAVAGVLALATPPARKDGMLVMETSGASRAAIVALIAEAALGFGSIAAFDVTLSVLCAVFAALYVIRYRRKCLREFGGATGDLIGCFVVKCETVLLAVVAAATVWADL